MLTVIGIDPGANGGFAVIGPDGTFAIKNPDTEADIVAELRLFSASSQCVAYLEQVHSMPKQGVVSVFSFGQNYGFLRGVLATLNVRRSFVRPQVWQKALGCSSKGDKNVTKRRAQELFPALKITHATADALLIAEYGRRLELGLLGKS